MNSRPMERLRTSRPCAGLSDSELARVESACRWRELEAGEMLASPGDLVFALYIVTRGRLKIQRRLPDGTERFLGYANLGDAVGQSCFLSDELDDDLKLVADIESQVAVIHRGHALILRQAVRILWAEVHVVNDPGSHWDGHHLEILHFPIHGSRIGEDRGVEERGGVDWGFTVLQVHHLQQRIYLL